MYWYAAKTILIPQEINKAYIKSLMYFLLKITDTENASAITNALNTTTLMARAIFIDSGTIKAIQTKKAKIILSAVMYLVFCLFTNIK